MEIPQNRNDTERDVLRNSEDIKSEKFTDTVYIKQEPLQNVFNNRDGPITVKNMKQEVSEVKKDIRNNEFKYEVELLVKDNERDELLSREAIKKQLTEEVDLIEQEIMSEEDIKQEESEAAQNLESEEIKGTSLTEETSFDRVKTSESDFNTQDTLDKPYVCNKCQQGFTDVSDLSKHMRTHRKKLLYSCEMCQRIFTNENMFRKHLKLHAKEKPIKCVLCEETFSKNKYLTDHIKRLHSKRFECEICHTKCISRKLLKIHTTQMHKVKEAKIFPCEYCGKEFKVKFYLDKHIRQHRPEGFPM